MYSEAAAFYDLIHDARDRDADAEAEVVNAAMRTAMEMAEKLAPYRHPKYATIKVTGDLQMPIHADASSAEIRNEIMQRLIQLAPVLELEAVLSAG